MTSVKGLAEYLTGVRGRRKTLVLFSEGIDYDITNAIESSYVVTVPVDAGGQVRDGTRDALTMTSRPETRDLTRRAASGSRVVSSCRPVRTSS